MPCLLCDHPDQTGEIIFDDDRVLVILHDDWATRGHLMVVWKEHVQNLSDLDDEQSAHFHRVYRFAERAALEAARAERAIVLKLGIAVPHLHVHIYPVSAALDRSEVQRIIDAAVRDPADESARRALVERMRSQLAALSR